MIEQTASPLAEASASSLDEFFSRRPPFDETTIMALIRELRRMRVKWETDGVAARPTKAKRAAKSAAAVPIATDDLWSAE